MFKLLAEISPLDNFLPLSLYSSYDIISPFLSWNSYISSSSFLWIWSNWVCREVNFISYRVLWWCKIDVSSNILVLNSWTDVTMLSSFSSKDNVLKREPLWDVKVSVLTLFRLWPMLALNVRMLIGHYFEQGDSSVVRRIPLSFKILEMRQQKGTHISDLVHRTVLCRTWNI